MKKPYLSSNSHEEKGFIKVAQMEQEDKASSSTPPATTFIAQVPLKVPVDKLTPLGFDAPTV